MSTVAERVANGAEWLDACRPGWERKIDLSTLELQDSCRCVLGQVVERTGDVDGFWTVARGLMTSLRDETFWGWAENHGFTRSQQVDMTVGEEWRALDEAWIALLKERFDTGHLSGGEGVG